MIHSRYGRQREAELAARTDPVVRAAIHATGVEVVSYSGFKP